MFIDINNASAESQKISTRSWISILPEKKKDVAEKISIDITSTYN